MKIDFSEEEVSAVVEELELEILCDDDEIHDIRIRSPFLASAYEKILQAYISGEEED